MIVGLPQLDPISRINENITCKDSIENKPNEWLNSIPKYEFCEMSLMQLNGFDANIVLANQFAKFPQ